MKKGEISNRAIYLILLIIALIFFYVPMPYSDTETYTEKEPYTDYEITESIIPYISEECRLSIPSSIMDVGSRAIESYLEENPEIMYSKCEEVTKYKNSINKNAVTKYKDVTKTRTVTKFKSLWEQYLDSRGYETYE